MNFCLKQKQTHRLVVAKGQGCWAGEGWGVWVSRSELLQTGWVNIRVLLRSTGSAFNILWRATMEKRFEKELSHLCNEQKLTQHAKSTILQ